MKSDLFKSNEKTDYLINRYNTLSKKTKNIAVVAGLFSTLFGIGTASSLYHYHNMDCDISQSLGCSSMKWNHYLDITGAVFFGLISILSFKLSLEASNQHAALLAKRVEHLNPKQ